MQKRWAGWLSVLGMAVTGCASTHMYALPMSGSQAQGTLDPLIACAGARNMESHRQDNGVDIKVEDGSFVRFAINGSGEFAMGTLVESSVPSGERKGKSEMLKARGDELYACATQSGTPAQANNGTATGPVVTAAPVKHSESEACNQLDRCYVEIATSLCEAKDAHCNNHFHQKIQADPTACQITLQNLPMMIAPMQKAKPNWQMPAVCMQHGNAAGSQPSASDSTP